LFFLSSASAQFNCFLSIAAVDDGDILIDGITNEVGITARSRNSNDGNGSAIVKEAAAVLNWPLQQQGDKGSCAIAYQPCTCSSSCCGDLVCGFPVRGRPKQAAYRAGVAAAEQSNSTADGSNPSSGANNAGALNKGGPSCRPLKKLDLKTGVVNFGCPA
jgi:hypothetical protein